MFFLGPKKNSRSLPKSLQNTGRISIISFFGVELKENIQRKRSFNRNFPFGTKYGINQSRRAAAWLVPKAYFLFPTHAARNAMPVLGAQKSGSR